MENGLPTCAVLHRHTNELQYFYCYMYCAHRCNVLCMIRDDFTTADPFQSRLTHFEAGRLASKRVVLHIRP